MTHKFTVWIPLLPPGINRQYGTSKSGHIFLRSDARVWKSHAAIIVGARAGDPRLRNGDDMGRRYSDMGGVHAQPHEAAGPERPAPHADDHAL